MSKEETTETFQDVIKAERERRKKKKALENSQFKMDEKEIIKEDVNTVSILKHKFTKDHPHHLKIVKLVERMGMELQKISDEGAHAYSYNQYVMFIDPNQKTIRFHEVFNVGDSFSMYIHEVENYSKIKKDFEYALFLKDGVELRKMIKKDREAWNSLYKKELGEW